MVYRLLLEARLSFLTGNSCDWLAHKRCFDYWDKMMEHLGNYEINGKEEHDLFHEIVRLHDKFMDRYRGFSENVMNN